MSASVSPPSYSPSNQPASTSISAEADPPPGYVSSETLKIGPRSPAELLVTPAQLKGHLALLEAFANLRVLVEHAKPETLPPHVPEDKERRWTWFVCISVERFEKWCLELREADLAVAGKELEAKGDSWFPPIDVLMVWHVYMLNPGWYTEDCNRIPPLTLLYHLGRYFVPTYASQARTDSWVRKTSRPFDPLEDAMANLSKAVRCLKCLKQNRVAYMNNDGTGYLQGGFSVICSECRFEFGKKHLRMRKFAEDIVRSGEKNGIYLAGTLQTPTKTLDIMRAKVIKTAILESEYMIKPSESSTEDEWVLSICTKTDWSIAKMTRQQFIADRARLWRIGRIVLAYNNPSIFSVDLAGAVVRQGFFVEKMRNLRWTDVGYFDQKEDEIALQHMVVRYHAFLDLMSSTPSSFFVPTLDIDLAWHTHQLMGIKYAKDCFTFLGRFIDHDDKVEESKLSSAFDITCRAWKDRFGVPYSHCGCPLPGKRIGEKLSRLLAKPEYRQISLVPQPKDDLLAATHASDHNAIYAYHKARSPMNQQSRLNKVRDRAANGSRVTRDQRQCTYDTPFIVPVPINYEPRGVAGGCVASSVRVVNRGATGCAVVRPVDELSASL